MFTKRKTAMQFLALGASVVIAIQLVYTLVNESSICPNAGCEFIEQLTTLSSLYINVLGLVYFQVIFWSLRLFENKSADYLPGRIDFTGLLLLGGLAAEGVLLAFQIFVARVVCSYCILIFSFVILLNLLNGRKQLISGVTIIIAILTSFSLLSFMPTQASSQFYSLENGSYGLKSCESPSKEAYLIFSSDCSHCVNVIKALDNCNSCDFYLNPIERLDAFNVNGLELNPSYSPEINRLMLKILGIKEVPVLVVRNKTGFSFIKGENNILHYVRHACFNPQPVLYFDQSLQSEADEMTILTEEGGECSLDVECKDE